MNADRAEMLKPFVTAVALDVIADKKARSVAPEVCTLHELAAAFREAAVEAMRSLCREQRFEGHININRTPMLGLWEGR